MENEQAVDGNSVRADVIRGVLASGIGIAVFLAADSMFHNRAAYFLEFAGHDLPYYQELNRFFIALPYVIGGVLVGFLAGAGRVTKLRFPVMRFVAGFGVYLLLNLAYTALFHPGVAGQILVWSSPGVVAFVCSLAVDWLYRRRTG